MKPDLAFLDILNSVNLNYTGNNIIISGDDPVLPTPYLVGTAGAAALASVGYAAANLWNLKTNKQQQIKINVYDAAIAQLSHQYVKLLTGKNEALWDPLSGFYKTRDERYVQLHCNFPNHRQGVIDFLRCSPEKSVVADVIHSKYDALELETLLNNLGLCASMIRTPQEWQETKQAQAIAELPLLEIIKITDTDPIPLPTDNSMPLSGIKALDLTRVIAGPVCGRTLAELGATVMRVGSSSLPEIPQLVLDTARGKLSVDLDFNLPTDKAQLYKLIQDTDIFSEAYRPGAMNDHGLSVNELCKIKPGLIYVSLNAYSHTGPWANRHGYDSLVQSATGIAYTQNGAMPKHLPCQTLDYVAGFISAFGAIEALRRRATNGGSYLVRTSLAQVAHWLINLGTASNFENLVIPSKEDINPHLTQTNGEFGLIEHLLPALKLSETPLRTNLPVVQIGSSKAQWI